MKAQYDNLPAALERDRDGSNIFRYNILEVQTENGTAYNCDEIRFWDEPNKTIIKRLIIRENFTESEEFAILNKYNSHLLGIDINENAVVKYTNFLLFLKQVDEILKNV